MYEQDLNIIKTKKEFIIQKPVLLKGNSSTNFIYKIDNLDFKFLNEINALKTFKEKFSFIQNHKASIEFFKIESELFKNNLILVESSLDVILSNLLSKCYETGIEKISDLTKLVAEINPVNFDDRYSQNFYEHKIKELLVHLTFGLNSNDVWKGQFDAYVFVKKNEDDKLIFFSLYELRELENYLFNKTKLEIINSSKCNFGKIFEENGEFFIKLNLQIRFC